VNQPHPRHSSASNGPRRRFVAFVVGSVLALPPVLLGTVSMATPSPAAVTSVPGGPVVLDGNDPGDHVAQITGYIRSVYANLEANLAPGYVHNGKTAVIGSCKSMLDGMAVPGETFDQFNSAVDVADLFAGIGANNYKNVHICSDDDLTLSTPVQTELDKWGSAIAIHVNRGGGLFATGHKYQWLKDLFPDIVVTPGGTSASYVTNDGADFFPTLPSNTLVNAVNHYTFTGVGPPLLPLLSELTNGFGELVAIGGTVVRFPQIAIDGPATGEINTVEKYTLTAATADGTLLSHNTFDYTISGPTGAAGSGTATTDANGQYTFTLSATSRGQTRIAVQLALGGSAAGSAVTTSWLDRPSAPTDVTATDVDGEPGNVQVDWTAPSDPGHSAVTDYVIQHSTDGTTWTTVADGTSTTTSYKLTGLVDGQPYRVRVAAVNGDGRGDWSVVASNLPYLPQVISFTGPGDVELGAGQLTVVATGGASGKPVTFTATGACSVAGTTVTLLAAGQCSLTANQAGDATYQPASSVTRTFTVTPAPAAPPVSTTPEVKAPLTGTIVAGSASAAQTTVKSGTKASLPVTCGLSNGNVADCTVRVYAFVDGHRVLVGHGVAPSVSTGDSGSTSGLSATKVLKVSLNKKGRAMAARPGGRKLYVVAEIIPAGSATPVIVRSSTTVVAKSFLLPRPIFFSPTSSTVREKGRAYLDRLRPRLGDVSTVTCVGYTDFNGQGDDNVALGLRRAKAVCDRLVRGTGITTRLQTHGERRPHAPNTTRPGRALNRRTEIRLSY
jgi:outer membrane protein OmpA-like peptidoglycan-associated protein